MPINNFPVIDSFLQFEQGSFYKFELLIRNTDGNNPLYQEGYSNTNKNILIKSWYIDTKEYYEKMKHEMRTLADLTGARLYVTLDRKKNFKLVQNLSHTFLDLLLSFTGISNPSIKKIYKTFASETSKKEASEHNLKTIMFDVDTTDEIIVDAVCNYIEGKGQKPYMLKTKKGYHIFCFRKFNHADWQNKCCEFICDDPDMTSRDEVISYHEMLCETVSVKENELGLVYHPMKEF